MYSITQSPIFAVDLAHAVMDENRRRADAVRLARKLRAPGAGRRLSAWRPSPWNRPVVAV